MRSKHDASNVENVIEYEAPSIAVGTIALTTDKPKFLWGAILNHIPSSKSIEEMHKLFPHNGQWHSVLKDKGVTWVDGNRVQHYSDERLT